MNVRQQLYNMGGWVGIDIGWSEGNYKRIFIFVVCFIFHFNSVGGFSF